MANYSIQTPLWNWLTSSGISFFSFCITVVIFLKERQKRRQPDRVIVSKYLSVFSYLCIIAAPIATLLLVVVYVPALCHVSRILVTPAHYLQQAAMECYQLSRLYYSFSKKQVHSEIGYPNWVFMLLTTVLIIWILAALTMRYLSVMTKECQIESDGTFVGKGIKLYLHQGWIVNALSLYIIIEVTTVLLYWCKIRSLRKFESDQDRVVHERIQSILHRVLILTFFYLFVTVLVWMLVAMGGYIHQDYPFDCWTLSVAALSISYSMFLMQDHNTSEYVAFLRFIKRYKCIWCFCCFGSMVDEQYRMLVDNADERKLSQKDSVPTWNMSADIEYGNNVTGMELSIATKTVCNVPKESTEESVAISSHLDFR